MTDLHEPCMVHSAVCRQWRITTVYCCHVNSVFCLAAASAAAADTRVDSTLIRHWRVISIAGVQQVASLLAPRTARLARLVTVVSRACYYSQITRPADISRTMYISWLFSKTVRFSNHVLHAYCHHHHLWLHGTTVSDTTHTLTAVSWTLNTFVGLQLCYTHAVERFTLGLEFLLS